MQPCKERDLLYMHIIQVQKLLEKFSKTLDAALDRKEREIMTV